jgi:hypothetical protein
MGQRGMPDNPPPGVEERIFGFIQTKLEGNPQVAVMEVQADAQAALYQTGDFRSAVMLTYTASEVLLDSVLMGLLWEEGKSPEEAAQLFHSPLLSRVRSQYHDRLRGNWQATRSDSPVGRWREQCVLVRHRVAHAGFEPEQEAAQYAFTSYRGLRTFAFDRLVASRNRYPRASAALVSPAGFQRRGAQTRRVEAVQRNLDEIFQQFLPWRNTVLNVRLERT